MIINSSTQKPWTSTGVMSGHVRPYRGAPPSRVCTVHTRTRCHGGGGAVTVRRNDRRPTADDGPRSAVARPERSAAWDPGTNPGKWCVRERCDSKCTRTDNGCPKCRVAIGRRRARGLPWLGLRTGRRVGAGHGPGESTSAARVRDGVKLSGPTKVPHPTSGQWICPRPKRSEVHVLITGVQRPYHRPRSENGYASTATGRS